MPQGNGMVREGTSECLCTIIFDDNTKITRGKKLSGKKTITSKNTYVIEYPDGSLSENENFGVDPLTEVLEASGVKVLKIDKDLEEVPNFLFQLDPPFLISSNGAVRSKTIGKLINANLFDASIRDIKGDILDLSKSLKEKSSQIDVLSENLKAFDSLKEEEDNLKNVEVLITRYEAAQLKVEKLKEYFSTLKTLKLNKVSLREKIDALKDINSCEMLLKDLINTNDKASHLKKILVNLNNIDIQKNNTKLALKSLEHIHRCEITLNKLIKNEESLIKLNIYNKKILMSISERAKLKKILDALPDFKTSENKLATLTSLREKTSALKDKIALITEIKGRIIKGRQFLRSTNNELIADTKEYATILKNLGKCPTCFSEIDNATLKNIVNKL